MSFGAGAAADPVSKYVRQSSAKETVIVFVHGVTSDGITSWTSGHVYWPDLLTQDHTFDGTDVFVYSYPTALWTTLTIDELAENMRVALVANGVTSYRNVIFLSHSMGGLVTEPFCSKIAP
jgi:hypothetical protein